VVSYAIPALIAVGIALFNHKKRKNPLTSLIRKGSVKPALKKLEKMVPESGGFLEAVPLTAFVSCCLMVSGHKENSVVTKGISFLLDLQRKDGSWPIDTDLAIWVTTLSVKAFGSRINQLLDTQRQEETSRFLLSIQNTKPHSFNGAAPGGWGWTNFSGSVPDADDTAGIVLALVALNNGKKDISNAIRSGCYWLMNLQNRDGGVPTFCKGWGKLPFDKSCADLSGHTLLALVKSGNFLDLTSGEEKKFTRSINKLLKYLTENQGDDGSWSPLWFGNQHHPGHKNPVYGTSRVCVYLFDSLQSKKLTDTQRDKVMEMLIKGRQYLQSQQNGNGSWGGQKGIPGTIEETSLAVSALVSFDEQACEKGFGWLEEEIEVNGFRSSPIGLYFASLWYDEKLYPLVFYAEALRRHTDFIEEQIQEKKHLKIEI
jgi:squalene-hopene/tetraprenyl-beta-curcumene cyclase